MRPNGWAAVAALLWLGMVGTAGTAGTQKAKPAAPAPPPGTAEFEQDTALGARLAGGQGTAEQFAELQRLAETGLAKARAQVTADPKSAQAAYVLGSWLIYGYRVVELETEVVDQTGMPRAERVRQVVVGLDDSPGEGLEALRRAQELAPESGQYALDYAAALHDVGDSETAMGVLKTAWAGQPKLTEPEQMKAGLLLSDVYAAQGRMTEAREWLYTALLLKAENAPLVGRLRQLDAEAAAAAQAELEAAVEAAWEEALGSQEEFPPEEMEEAPEEETPSSEMEGYEEEAPAEEWVPEEEGNGSEGGIVEDVPWMPSGQEESY